MGLGADADVADRDHEQCSFVREANGYAVPLGWRAWWRCAATLLRVDLSGRPTAQCTRQPRPGGKPTCTSAPSLRTMVGTTPLLRV